MSTLICMAVYSTEENGRATYTKQTLMSLLSTVNFNVHRLFVSDNGSCNSLQTFYGDYENLFCESFPKEHLTIRKNGKNLGTAMAVNIGIRTREKGQGIIKMDDDVVVHQGGWVEEMEEAIKREPKIAIVALKREDLGESPNAKEEMYRSKLVMLPREKGMSWLVVEQLKGGAIGTCEMLSSALLDKIGFMWQPSLYAWDDADISERAQLCGFASVFIPHIKITHLDTGVTEGGIKTEFIKWKIEEAGRAHKAIGDRILGYKNGTIPLEYIPNWEELEN